MLCISLSSSLLFMSYAKVSGHVFDQGMPSFSRMVLIMAGLFGVAPAVWTVAAVLAEGRSLTRSTLRVEFQSQRFIFAVFNLPFTVSLCGATEVGKTLGQSRVLLWLSLLPWLAASVWLLVAEYRLWKPQPGTNLVRRRWVGFVVATILSPLLSLAAQQTAQKIWP
jgi:hypothetical protein